MNDESARECGNDGTASAEKRRFNVPTRRRLALVATLACYVAMQLALQPRFVQIGDPSAIRIEAWYLTAYGQLGVPASEADGIVKTFIPPFSKKNQYFWENPHRGRFFSLWGIANTFAFAIPMHLIANQALGLQPVVWWNLGNLLWSTIFFGVFLTLVQRDDEGLWPAIAYSVLSVASSVLVYYTRAQAAEIFQMTLLLLAYLLMRYCDAALVADPREQRVVLKLAALHLVFAALVLARFYFIGMYFLAVVLLHWGRWRTARQRNLLVLSACFFALTVGAQLWVNYFKFDNPWQVGIGQAFIDHDEGAYALSHFPRAIADYLWAPNWSLFRYLPVLWLAILGIPRMWRHRPRELLMVWGSMGIMIIVACGWRAHGEWAYGPRYFVQVLGLIAVTGFAGLQSARAWARSAPRRVLLAVGLSCLVVAGCRDEFYANFFEPFTTEQIKGTFEQVTKDHPRIPIEDASTLATLEQFHAWCFGKKDGEIADGIELADKLHGAAYAASLDTQLRQRCTPNLLLLDF